MTLTFGLLAGYSLQKKNTITSLAAIPKKAEPNKEKANFYRDLSGWKYQELSRTNLHPPPSHAHPRREVSPGVKLRSGRCERQGFNYSCKQEAAVVGCGRSQPKNETKEPSRPQRGHHPLHNLKTGEWTVRAKPGTRRPDPTGQRPSPKGSPRETTPPGPLSHPPPLPGAEGGLENQK